MFWAIFINQLNPLSLPLSPPPYSFPSNFLPKPQQNVQINSLLEQQVGSYVAQYMWTLRIYKNRPDGSDLYKI